MLDAMEKQIIHVYSSVRSELKRRVLFKGTAFAIVGALLVLTSGLFLPPFWMQYFGFPLLIVGILCIAYGLMPYKRLTRLETQPHELVVTDDQNLHYAVRGQHVLTVPLQAIDRLSYCDEGVDRYGIALDLKRGMADQVTLQKKGASIDTYLTHMRRRYACDLFFPYFSQRSYREVADSL